MSAPLLVVLTRWPRWVLALLMAGFLVAGLAWDGPGGAALLLVLATFLGWLLALAWPALAAPSRLVRLAVIGALLVVAAVTAGSPESL